MFEQLAPEPLQSCHWYAYDVGLPLHVPLLVVSGLTVLRRSPRTPVSPAVVGRRSGHLLTVADELAAVDSTAVRSP